MKKPVCNYLDDCINGKAAATKEDLAKYCKYWIQHLSPDVKAVSKISLYQFTGLSGEEMWKCISGNSKLIIQAAVERRRKQLNELSSDHVL